MVRCIIIDLEERFRAYMHKIALVDSDGVCLRSDKSRGDALMCIYLSATRLYSPARAHHY